MPGCIIFSLQFWPFLDKFCIIHSKVWDWQSKVMGGCRVVGVGWEEASRTRLIFRGSVTLEDTNNHTTFKPWEKW